MNGQDPHYGERLAIKVSVGEMGHTILVRNGRPQLLHRLLFMMRRLAEEQAMALTIRTDAEFELHGLDRIEMHLFENGSREVLDVRRVSNDVRSVVWGNDAEGWLWCVQLAEPVARANVPCHAYLGLNAVGNAVLEFSNEVGPGTFERSG